MAQFLAGGKSGVMYGISSTRVLKEFHNGSGGEIEYQVYQRLGSYPNITKLLDIRKDGSIILERGEPLRTVYRASTLSEIPIQRKISWLRHAAEGYQHLYICNIVHADIGCNNLILTEDNCVKLIDFEGSSIDGRIADSCYEWFSYCPSEPRISPRTDIFVFGCAIYKILTGRPPYYELEASNDPYRQVEELYTNRRFPHITDLPLGALIQSCWYSKISSMSEVV